MSEQFSDPELLAKRLDQVLPPDSAKTPPETPDRLVNLATSLARMPVPELSPQMIARIEMRMFEAFEAQHSARHSDKVIRRATWRWMQTGLAAGAAALLFLIVAPSVSASVPGSPLYPIKRQVEQVQLTLTQWIGDDVGRSALLMDLAERRAGESLTLVERGMFDAALVENAVESLEALDSSTVSNSPNFRVRHAETIFILGEVIHEAEAAALAEPGVVAALTEQLANIALPEASAQPPAGGDGRVDGEQQPPLTEDTIVSPTPSPVPTDTPAATSTPTAPLSGEPPETPSPTVAPTQTMPPTPAPSRTSTAVPAASSTLSPTSTALPSQTPTPRMTNTRHPTNTPRANPTARPTNTHRPPGDADPGQPAATNVPPGQSGDNPGNGNGSGNGGGKP